MFFGMFQILTRWKLRNYLKLETICNICLMCLIFILEMVGNVVGFCKLKLLWSSVFTKNNWHKKLNKVKQ